MAGPAALRGMAAEAAAIQLSGELCDHCTGRVFARRARARDAARLGARLRRAGAYAEPRRCSVCGTMSARLGETLDEMLRLTEGMQFGSFLVGATLRPSVLDADDAMRARHGLRGTPSVKAGVTGALSRMFARRTRARAERVRPDISLRVDMRDGAVSVESRPVYVTGRYTKSERGLPQRQRRCARCGGRGCAACAGSGMGEGSSVESKIAGVLLARLGARQARFSWCGGEDADGTVSGRGRPFHARIACPARRRARFAARIGLGGAELLGARVVGSPPPAAPAFASTISLRVRADAELGAAVLRRLRTLRGAVRIYGGLQKVSTRDICSVRYRRRGPAEFVLVMRAEGGFPLRRFVAGSDVSPNLSDLLDARCTYVSADFADVDLAKS